MAPFLFLFVIARIMGNDSPCAPGNLIQINFTPALAARIRGHLRQTAQHKNSQGSMRNGKCRQ